MKFTSVSSRLLLTLFVATPTVAISTLNSVNAQSFLKPTLSNSSVQLSQLSRKTPGVDKVIAQAKNDPAFYQALVSNPEKTLANVNYLDAATKSSLAKLISQEASFGRIDEAASGCVCTGCCVTQINKRDNIYRLDPLRGGLNPVLQQPAIKPQNQLR